MNGVEEQRMRAGCGSATIGMFARQWHGHVDEVIVVDDHITGVLTEHQAGACLDMPRAGIRVQGRKSTPGRYFQVAGPGTGWGGNRCHRAALHHPHRRSEGGVARDAGAAHDHHRRGQPLLHSRRRPADPGAGADPRAGAPRGRSHRGRTASRRSARCCSWPEPAGRCEPGSPTIRSC